MAKRRYLCGIRYFLRLFYRPYALLSFSGFRGIIGIGKEKRRRGTGGRIRGTCGFDFYIARKRNYSGKGRRRLDRGFSEGRPEFRLSGIRDNRSEERRVGK